MIELNFPRRSSDIFRDPKELACSQAVRLFEEIHTATDLMPDDPLLRRPENIDTSLFWNLIGRQQEHAEKENLPGYHHTWEDAQKVALACTAKLLSLQKRPSVDPGVFRFREVVGCSPEDFLRKYNYDVPNENNR